MAEYQPRHIRRSSDRRHTLGRVVLGPCYAVTTPHALPSHTGSPMEHRDRGGAGSARLDAPTSSSTDAISLRLYDMGEIARIRSSTLASPHNEPQTPACADAGRPPPGRGWLHSTCRSASSAGPAPAAPEWRRPRDLGAPGRWRSPPLCPLSTLVRGVPPRLTREVSDGYRMAPHEWTPMDKPIRRPSRRRRASARCILIGLRRVPVPGPFLIRGERPRRQAPPRHPCWGSGGAGGGCLRHISVSFTGRRSTVRRRSLPSGPMRRR